MKNKEKYKDKIFEIACKGKKVAIVNNKPVACDGLYCYESEYDAVCDEAICDEALCSNNLKQWMESEYEELEINWTKIPVDTKVLVSNNGKEWLRRYFAKYDKTCVHTFNSGATSWSDNVQYSLARWNYAKLAEEGIDND